MVRGLSDKELSELKQQLGGRFDELRAEVRQELLSSSNERYIRLAGRVHDSGDEAVADLLADVNLAIINQHVKEIQDIEAAQLRMGKGVYGICIDCNDNIGYKRLKAYPTAKRCYDCQARYEKTQPRSGHPTL